MQPSIQLNTFREACEKGDLDKVNALIVGSDRKDLDKQDENGRNALHFAAMMGMVQEINALIKKGVNPFCDNENNFPLDLAIKNNKGEAVNILNQYNLDRNLQKESYKNNPDKIIKLLEDKANPHYRNGEFRGVNALQIATLKGNVASMIILIRAGVDVNALDDNGSSALYLAAQSGNTKSLELLTKALKIDLNLSNNLGITPLHIASSENQFDAVKAILKKQRANLDLADKDGYTPILTAIKKGHIEIFEALLNAKASVDVKNNIGETALHIAARNGNTQIFDLLLTKVDVDIRDASGKTALEIAESQKNEVIIKEGEIIRFLSELRESRERESSQTPNDSEYDADNSGSSRSPSPSPKRVKKLDSEVEKTKMDLGNYR